MPRTHHTGHGRPARKRRRCGGPRQYPVCPATGKRRLGKREDVVLALAVAVRTRAWADAHDRLTNRHEVRGYRCGACRG
jgi:hypothetical protein